MNIQQQKFSIQIARQVRDRNLTSSAAAKKIHDDLGIKLGSGKIVIEVYLRMIQGLEFKRTLSATDMDFFVKAIADEEGAATLKLALDALRQHIQYRQESGISQKKNIEILEKYKQRLAEINAIEVDDVENLHEMYMNFSDAVEQALRDSAEKRKVRLAKARHIPKRILKKVYVYDRNPDVVAEVLFRAHGVCQACKEKAPFLRKNDGSPYLEVHHRLPLSENGEDTVANAIALCPNCHRKGHFG